MSDVRVTYSGLISFFVGLIGVFTGLIFTLIITRQLSQEEFGTWGLIGSLTVYVLIFEPIISYWTTREIARGGESGKTAIITGGIFSISVIPLYLLIVIVFFNQIQVDLNVLFFSSLIVPVLFFRHILASINMGYKPQNASYGILMFEITKIPLALVLVYFLEMGVYGAIITVILASISSIIIQIILSFEKIKTSFNRKLLKKWLKLFWLPTYPRISEVLTNSDIVIVTIIMGTVQPLAFWVVAMTISGIVLHSAKIAKPLYPKLLGGGKKEYLQESLTRVFYFAVPLISISLIFARPGLFALNPIYETVVSVVWVLTFVLFLRALSNIFTVSLTGIEKVDTFKESTFKDYLKSKLFYLPTLKIIQRSIYIISLTIMLLLISSSSDQNLVLSWSIVALVTQIPYTLYLYHLVKKEFNLQISWVTVSKYLVSGFIVFGMTFILMDNFLIYKTSIFEFLPLLFQFLIIGVGGYFGLTYVLDSRTRKLLKSIIAEIKK